MISGWPLAVTFTEVGSDLPAGVSLASNGALTGTVSPGAEGSYAPVFRVANAEGDAVPDGVGDILVNTTPVAPIWDPGGITLPSVTIGEGYGSLDLDTFISDDGGDPTITFTDDGGLPAGIGLNQNGTFFGAATTLSTGNVIFTATNSGGPTDSASTPWIVGTLPVVVDGWTGAENCA